MRSLGLTLAATAAMMLVGALLVTGVANGEHFNAFYNSDIAHVFMVTRDVSSDIAAFGTWNHSPAFYFFPDWVLAYFIGLVVPENWAKPLAYAVLLVTFYALLTGFVTQSLFPQRRFWPLAWAALGLFVVVFAIATLVPSSRGSWTTVVALVAYWHTGSILFVLLCLGALLRWWADGRNIWLYLISASCLLATFSDALFLVWFAGPAVIVLLLDAAVRRRLSRWSALLAISVPTAATYLVEGLLNPNRQNYMRNDATLAQSVDAFVQSIGIILQNPDPLIALYLVTALASVVAAAVVLSQGLSRRGMSPLGAFHLFAGGSVTAMFLAPVMMRQFLHPDHWRYFVLLPVLALVWLLVTVLARVRVTTPLKIGSATVVAAGLLGMGTSLAARPFDPSLLYPLPACLLDAGLKVGIGDYWTTKRSMFLSQDQLVFVQVGADGLSYDFNYNRAWHEDARNLGGPTFAVLTNLDPAAISSRFGTPGKILQCGNDTVWVYDQALAFE